MARSLESRIEKLEGAGERQNRSLIGVLTVDLSDSMRAASFRVLGFHLEDLEATAKPSVPRLCLGGMDFHAVVTNCGWSAALYERLRALPRDARSKLAAKHGYRVIYPGEPKG